MTDPGRFGAFVLLKQLGSDALGERYRAGLAAGGSMRDVVMLQLFTGAGIDATALVADARQPGTVVEPVARPSMASQVGEVDGLPYAAYMHRQSFALPAFLARANSGFSTLATEHAVLIAERLAKVVVAFHRAELIHGFIVPSLTLISAEGETLLIGGEHGAALAAQTAAGKLERSFGAYLAPEVLAGEPPLAVDDVYGLGALLFELVTGAPLLVGEPVEPQLAAATEATTGGPLPRRLFDLLRRSLTTRDGRLADAGDWHRDLSAWLHETAVTATNFDLAFVVYELHRDEIEGYGAASAAPQAVTPDWGVPQPAAPQPAAPEPGAPQPAAPEPGAPQPAAPEPVAPQPAAPQPAAPQPGAPPPAAPQPVAPQPVAPQPVAPQPAAPQPAAPQPAASMPAAAQPAVPVPAAPEPVAADPVVVEPVAAEPIAADPVVVEPIAAEPIAAQPIAPQPAAPQPAAPQPGAPQPAAPQPGAPPPAAPQPAAPQPAAPRPAAPRSATFADKTLWKASTEVGARETVADVPPVFAPADVAAEPAATVATPATGVQGAAVAGSAAAAEAGPASARRWVLPVLITALAGTAAWAAWTLRGDPAPVAPPPVVAPLPPPPPPPTIDLEAAQAELERLVTERTSALGKRLADDYDEQIGELETQIVQARDQAAGDPPQLVSVPSPAYPEAAGEGRQAAVRVRVLVAADGSVRQAELAPEGGAGPAFDELAVRTARRARFQPVAGGRDRWTEVVVRFAPPGP